MQQIAGRHNFPGSGGQNHLASRLTFYFTGLDELDFLLNGGDQGCVEYVLNFYIRKFFLLCLPWDFLI